MMIISKARSTGVALWLQDFIHRAAGVAARGGCRTPLVDRGSNSAAASLDANSEAVPCLVLVLSDDLREERVAAAFWVAVSKGPEIKAAAVFSSPPLSVMPWSRLIPLPLGLEHLRL